MIGSIGDKSRRHGGTWYGKNGVEANASGAGGVVQRANVILLE